MNCKCPWSDIGGWNFTNRVNYKGQLKKLIPTKWGATTDMKKSISILFIFLMVINTGLSRKTNDHYKRNNSFSAKTEKGDNRESRNPVFL